MTVPDVVVVDHHDSYTQNLVHLVAAVTGRLPRVVQHDETTAESVLEHSHVVLSPGPGHPDDPADFGVGREVLLRATRPRAGHRSAVPVVNHVRIPALAAGLTLLMFLPGIIEQGSRTYLAATGQTQEPFLGRWLWLTAALFGVSAVIYAVRLVRARRSGTAELTQ